MLGRRGPSAAECPADGSVPLAGQGRQVIGAPRAVPGSGIHITDQGSVASGHHHQAVAVEPGLTRDPAHQRGMSGRAAPSPFTTNADDVLAARRSARSRRYAHVSAHEAGDQDAPWSAIRKIRAALLAAERRNLPLQSLQASGADGGSTTRTPAAARAVESEVGHHGDATASTWVGRAFMAAPQAISRSHPHANVRSRPSPVTARRASPHRRRRLTVDEPPSCGGSHALICTVERHGQTTSAPMPNTGAPRGLLGGASRRGANCAEAAGTAEGGRRALGSHGSCVSDRRAPGGASTWASSARWLLDGFLDVVVSLRPQTANSSPRCRKGCARP